MRAYDRGGGRSSNTKHAVKGSACVRACVCVAHADGEHDSRGADQTNAELYAEGLEEELVDGGASEAAGAGAGAASQAPSEAGDAQPSQLQEGEGGVENAGDVEEDLLGEGDDVLEEAEEPQGPARQGAPQEVRVGMLRLRVQGAVSKRMRRCVSCLCLMPRAIRACVPGSEGERTRQVFMHAGTAQHSGDRQWLLSVLGQAPAPLGAAQTSLCRARPGPHSSTPWGHYGNEGLRVCTPPAPSECKPSALTATLATMCVKS